MPAGAKRTNPCPYVVTLIFFPELLILMGSKWNGALLSSKCSLYKGVQWMGSHRPWALASHLFMSNCSVYNSVLHMHGFISTFIVSHNLFSKGWEHGCKVTSGRLGKQMSSMRERNYTTSAFWVYENLTPDCSRCAKQSYYLHSHLQERQIKKA